MQDEDRPAASRPPEPAHGERGHRRRRPRAGESVRTPNGTGRRPQGRRRRPPRRDGARRRATRGAGRRTIRARAMPGAVAASRAQWAAA